MLHNHSWMCQDSMRKLEQNSSAAGYNKESENSDSGLPCCEATAVLMHNWNLSQCVKSFSLNLNKEMVKKKPLEKIQEEN